MLGIDVVVNGTKVATAAQSLLDLVHEQRFAGARIATALNGNFVPEPLRATTALQPGDRIEIVSARQGG